VRGGVRVRGSAARAVRCGAVQARQVRACAYGSLFYWSLAGYCRCWLLVGSPVLLGSVGCSLLKPGSSSFARLRFGRSLAQLAASRLPVGFIIGWFVISSIASLIIVAGWLVWLATGWLPSVSHRRLRWFVSVVVIGLLSAGYWLVAVCRRVVCCLTAVKACVRACAVRDQARARCACACGAFVYRLFVCRLVIGSLLLLLLLGYCCRFTVRLLFCRCRHVCYQCRSVIIVVFTAVITFACLSRRLLFVCLVVCSLSSHYYQYHCHIVCWLFVPRFSYQILSI
jgi:hypothetical protein